MNQLSYRQTDDNGLSFELLVDGRPLADLVGARDSAIPCWLIGDDPAAFPPESGTGNPEIRIVTVCSCGEYGCGHTSCRVIRSNSEVLFRDFDLDCSTDGRRQRFAFSRINFEEVAAGIMREARRFREETEQQRNESRG